MSVTPADVARLAALAALEVADDQVPALAAQLDRIVSYVGQLAALGETGEPAADEPIPGAGFRADVVRHTPMAAGPADFAPQFTDGFFVVPRSKARADG